MDFKQKLDKVLLEERRHPYFRCTKDSWDGFHLIVPLGITPEEAQPLLEKMYDEVIWRKEQLPEFRLRAFDGKKVFVPKDWPTQWA